MPINPVVLADAFVADTNPANPAGDGLGFVPTVSGFPYFIKFPAAAGLTYTVSTNVIPGDLVVLGPDGNPLNPGVAVKTMAFTVPANGLYVLAFTANPQAVAAGTEVTIDITANDLGLTNPIFGGGLEDPNNPVFDPFGGLAGAVLGFNKGPDGMFGQSFHYVLHAPDGNANGLATALPNIAIDPIADGNISTITPLEMPTPGTVGNPNQPLTWVGATDAPGMPGSPIQISISAENFNYTSDAAAPVTFAPRPLTTQDLNLLVAATHVWEAVANVHFNFIEDAAPGQQPSDVRVGLADINSSSLAKPGMTFVGDTEIRWDANNKMLPDTLVSIEDPNETATTQLADGDQQYNGTTATMFQSMIHELGHSLGLDHNPTDPNSIMNPSLSSSNPLPDGNDIAAIDSLYGAPTNPVDFANQADQTLYNNLISHA